MIGRINFSKNGVHRPAVTPITDDAATVVACGIVGNASITCRGNGFGSFSNSVGDAGAAGFSCMGSLISGGFTAGGSAGFGFGGTIFGGSTSGSISIGLK